jgi:hypothetical protein
MSLQLGCSGKSSHATNNVNNGTNDIQVDAALEAKRTQPTIGSVWISMVISTSLWSLTGEQIRLDIDKDPLNSTDDQIGSRISPSVTATNEPASHTLVSLYY